MKLDTACFILQLESLQTAKYSARTDLSKSAYFAVSSLNKLGPGERGFALWTPGGEPKERCSLGKPFFTNKWYQSSGCGLDG